MHKNFILEKGISKLGDLKKQEALKNCLCPSFNSYDASLFNKRWFKNVFDNLKV